MKDVGYMRILAGYIRSIFRDFESYLRTEVDLLEDDIRLVLDEYKSSFCTYELEPGIYTVKDFSESVFSILQPEYEASSNVSVIEFDDITMKTKLVVRPSIIAISIDEKSFFSTILGFTSGWDYKHYDEYISQITLNLSSTNKVHLKFDCYNRSIINAVQQPR